MANSVGSVSIDLEARIAKFESDMGRAARIAEQRSAEMRRTIGTIATALGAGISIAGFTAWIKGAINAQDAISKMSQKVGVSTEALSGWQLAAQQAGVENEAFAKGLVKLSQSALMAVQNSKMQVDSFRAIGVSVNDSTGHLKAMDQLFPEVIDKLSKFRDGTAKTAVATQIFGRAGAELIPLINAGKEGLADYIKMADDFGLIVGGKGAKAAEAFNDSLEQLGFVGKGVANQLATALAPALADLAEKAVAFFRSGDWKKILDDISTGAKYVADHVGDIITAVKTLGEVLATVYALKLLKSGTDWIGNLTAQGVAVDALGKKTVLSLGQTVKNVGLLQTGINLLGSAVVGWQIGTYLYNQFQIVRDAGAVAIGTILVGWEKLKSGAQVAFLAISDFWSERLAGMRSAFNTFQSGIATILQHNLIPQVREAGDKLQAELVKSATANAGELEATLTKNAIARMKVREEANKKIVEIRANTWSGVGIANNNGTKDSALAGIKGDAEAGKDALTLLGSAASDAAKKAATAMQALYDGLQKIKDAANPAEAAYSQFAETVRGMAKLGAAAIAAGADVATVQGVVAQAVTEANKKLMQELGKPMIAAKEYADALDQQLTSRKRLIDSQVAAIGMGTKEAANQQQLAQVYQESADSLAKLQRQHELHPEAFGEGQYEAELESLKRHNEAMLQATIDGQDAISAAQADWRNGVNRAIDNFMDEQRDKAKQAEEFSNAFMSGFRGAFVDFASGAASAKDAFGSFVDDMYKRALAFVADKAMQAFFDSFGAGSQSGSSGGGWGGLISAFAGAFSGGGGGFGPGTIGAGLAVGGMAYPGSIHPVNENGPEIFTYQNRDYLAAGAGSVKVTPITSGGSAGNTFVTNVNVQPTSTRRTADQVAQEVARKQRVATSRAA